MLDFWGVSTLTTPWWYIWANSDSPTWMWFFNMRHLCFCGEVVWCSFFFVPGITEVEHDCLGEHLGGIYSPIVTPWPTRRRSKLRLETTIPTAQPKTTLLNDFATQKKSKKIPQLFPFHPFHPTQRTESLTNCWWRNCSIFPEYLGENFELFRHWNQKLCTWMLEERLCGACMRLVFAVGCLMDVCYLQRQFQVRKYPPGTIFNKNPSKREVRKIIIHSKVPNGRGICDRATQSWPYNQSRWSL